MSEYQFGYFVVNLVVAYAELHGSHFRLLMYLLYIFMNTKT